MWSVHIERQITACGREALSTMMGNLRSMLHLSVILFSILCLQLESSEYKDFLILGMAKAALEAINGCNLFGDKGASWSVVYVDIDAHNRNRSIFETMLPRESSSKVELIIPIDIQYGQYLGRLEGSLLNEH